VTEVHRAAARGFQAAAEVYERSRPDYPMEAIDRMVQDLEIGPAAVVMDLGAGTGKLARMLLPTGARLVGLEPVDAMRRVLAEAVPEVAVVGGVAESLPFADGTFDAVVAGQAFHWFRGEAALAEIHRVLRPAGRLGLIWNIRDHSIPWIARLTEIIDPYEAGAPRERTRAWRAAFAATDLFGTLQQRRFGHLQRFDPDGLADRVASMSFIASLPDGAREEVLRRVRRLARENADEQGVVSLPYFTDLYWCARARGPEPDVPGITGFR
jgi:SAM-dependent methyltransferase